MLMWIDGSKELKGKWGSGGGLGWWLRYLLGEFLCWYVCFCVYYFCNLILWVEGGFFLLLSGMKKEELGSWGWWWWVVKV